MRLVLGLLPISHCFSICFAFGDRVSCSQHKEVKYKKNDYRFTGNTEHIPEVESLTYVDSLAVPLHQEQHKHMERDEVDDEHITSPRRDLWEKRGSDTCFFSLSLPKASMSHLSQQPEHKRKKC